MKGIVLLNVSLSREVVPSFARILLHTSLGKKHLVRPLLRTEITQVVNRRAWYDSTKMTAEVLTLYKVLPTVLYIGHILERILGPIYKSPTNILIMIFQFCPLYYSQHFIIREEKY